MKNTRSVPVGLAIALVCPSTRSQEALERLNGAFRQVYVQAKAAALEHGGPVLLVSGDKVQLFRHNLPVAEASIHPKLYHQFKAVAHVPLALQVLPDGPDQAFPAARLREMRGMVLAVRDELATWCPPAALGRQRRILDACLELMDQRLKEGRLPPGRMAAFAADMGPLLLANCAEAAAQELQQLDQAVAQLRKGMAPGEWQATRVVISTVHMAREDEISYQYFSRLLGETREGGRIVVGEGVWQPKDALDLLATHLVDEAAGGAFFGDPMRMHRDVLADGGRAWLDRHPPAP